MKHTGTCFSSRNTFLYEGCSFNVVNNVVRYCREWGLVSSLSGFILIAILRLLLSSRILFSGFLLFYLCLFYLIFMQLCRIEFLIEVSLTSNQRTGLEICSVKTIVPKVAKYATQLPHYVGHTAYILLFVSLLGTIFILMDDVAPIRTNKEN